MSHNAICRLFQAERIYYKSLEAITTQAIACSCCRAPGCMSVREREANVSIIVVSYVNKEGKLLFSGEELCHVTRQTATIVLCQQ